VIGQTELVGTLKRRVSQGFPGASILLGERGCGKHTLAKDIATWLGLDEYDITDSLDFERISGIYGKQSPGVYVADLTDASVREQNAILKLLEEPPSNAYIILLAECEENVLETVLGRCVKYRFGAYSDAELYEFILSRHDLGDGVERAIPYCRTPGKLSALNSETVAGTESLCDAIVNRIGSSSFPNAMSIVKKVNYKDEYDKFDFGLFVGTLRKKAYESALADSSHSWMYGILRDECRKLKLPSISKERWMEHLICALWVKSKEGNG